MHEQSTDLGILVQQQRDGMEFFVDALRVEPKNVFDIEPDVFLQLKSLVEDVDPGMNHARPDAIAAALGSLIQPFKQPFGNRAVELRDLPRFPNSHPTLGIAI